jgi:nitroreductase
VSAGPGDGLEGFLALARGQAAVRRFHADPVDAAVVERVLEAATRAPSASNSQPWRFVVVRDPGRRRALRDAYLSAWEMVRPPAAAQSPVQREAGWLAGHLDTAPVIVAACLDEAAVTTRDPAARYGSILPAVQNLCLAARAAGLGTVLTTLARRADPAVRAALDVPDGVEVVALVPLGWPEGGFPATRRRPVAEVAFAETWGRPLGEA